VGDQILLLVVGFVLTTVAGGALGYYFQRRTWNANRREAERQEAATVFGEVSRLMDRRLYRMWSLLWRLDPGPENEQRLPDDLTAYRDLLREWNDSLNRNLALTQRYFGAAVGDFVDRVLYEEFKRLGGHLEDLYRRRGQPHIGSESDRLDGEVKALSDEVYQLNRYMIALIQQGNVGLYHSAGREPVERAPWELDLRLGSRGPRVAAWQTALTAVGASKLAVDGRFGAATDAATRDFQRDFGLPQDGTVGPDDRAAMDARLPPIRRPNW
jgi:hypothetical protein